MAHLHFFVLTCLSVLRLTQSTSDICDEHLSIQKTTAMLNLTYPACRNIDLRLQLFICEVGEGDTFTSSTADPIPCPDGSWNKICYPVPRNNVIYALSCVCRSIVNIWNAPDVRNTSWSNWEIVAEPESWAYQVRRLMMEGGDCIAREFIKIRPVISGYNLPDSVYTASSSYSADFAPYKANMNSYLTGSCAWVPQSQDTIRWLGITLPGGYITKGAVVSRKCSFGMEYPTVVNVTTSHDDVTWVSVVEGVDLMTLYGDTHDAYIWFATTYTTRFWKIYMVEFDGQYQGRNARMKADLIGVAV